MMNSDYSDEQIAPVLPDYFGSSRGDPLPSDIIGSQIVKIGTFTKTRVVEGGGLVVDYRPSGAKEDRRIVFAFSELGMWVVWNGPLETSPNQALVQ